ncbi:hypothetical protein QR680_009821 [Steinernema hermaphroditum]|uniref:BTB domain-containing protein n=1 Tax=Steinernema hermaphroditum TaxID=289476 RepID=A0AA39INP6_9BILA|nr:hypothetical protein QR680_009821 [Steinernema hermaphroditum]
MSTETLQASTKLTFRLQIADDAFHSEKIEWNGLSWSLAGIRVPPDGRWDLTVECTKENSRFIIWHCFTFGDILIEQKRFQWGRQFFKDISSCTVNSIYPMFGPAGVTKEVEAVIIINVYSLFCVDLMDPNNRMILSDADRAKTDVEGTTLYLSKSILAKQSPFFDVLFNKDFKEKIENEFHLLHIDIDEFVEFISYMYPADRKITTMELCQRLLHMTDRFGCDSVKAVCEMYLVQAAETAVHDELGERYMLGIVTSDPNAYSVPPPKEKQSISMVMKGENYANPCTLYGDWPLTQEFHVYSSPKQEIGGFMLRFHVFGRNQNEPERVCIECTKPDSLELWRCDAFGEISVKFADGKHEKNLISQVWRDQFNSSQTSKIQETEPFLENIIFGDLIIEVNMQIIRSYSVNLAEQNCLDSVSLKVDGRTLFISRSLLSHTCEYFHDLLKDGQTLYEVSDVSLKDFTKFLAFLYPITSKIGCSVDEDLPHPYECQEVKDCEKLILLQKRFGCSLVKNICEDHILRDEIPITRENIEKYELSNVARSRFPGK